MYLLVYQQGGTLYLDEPLGAQPTACTLTLTGRDGTALSSIDSSFSDVAASACTVETLSLTLAAANAGAREVAVTATAGTPVSGLDDRFYRLLITNTDNRKILVRVSGWETSGGDITNLKIDTGLPWDIAAGATAKSVRCTKAISWSAVTSTFTGSLMAVWRVTVDGAVKPIVKEVDVVRQVPLPPISWADVLDQRSDLNHFLGPHSNPERLVLEAWDRVLVRLMNIRTTSGKSVLHTSLVDNGGPHLRQAAINELLMLLASQHNYVPSAWEGDVDGYLDDMDSAQNRALAISNYADLDEDGLLSESEKAPVSRHIWFGS